MPAPPAASHPAQLSLFGEVPATALTVAVAPPTAPTAPNQAVPAAPAPSAPLAPPMLAPATFAHPRAQREAHLDGHHVGYEFRRARRRSIGFVIGAEGLTVSAPRWVGAAEIDAALREKAGWILRKLQEQQARARRLDQARVDWRDGTTIPFLGETVIVVLDPRTTGAVLHDDPQGAARRPPEGESHRLGRPGAVLHDAVNTLPGVPRLTLHVGLPQAATPEQLREAVQSWLQRQARRIFEERCAIFAPRLGVRLRRLSLSSAATRWGSASADGSVRLNWRLVHFGLPVIDYVVAHELAHLREMNHSDAFWNVVRSVLPDYEAARGTLRTEVLPVFE